MVLFNCSCGNKEEVLDFILNVFNNSTIICSKCKKTMKREIDMSKHPNDPRPELKEDAFIWKELLDRLYKINASLYYVFHGLRCAGSKLKLLPEDIKFTFSDEFDDKFINKVRKEHLTPNKDLILATMKKLAKDLNKNKKTSLTDCPF